MTHRMLVTTILTLVALGTIANDASVHASDRPAAKNSAKRPALSHGMKVEVGGYKLWIKCVGKGNPTVVLDTPLGVGGQTAWFDIWPRIAKFDRVCIYDHAGVENSDRRPGGGNTTVAVQAHELHTLLQHAHVSPPYVTGAWADGGYIVRMFAYTYRAEVAGMVLVDTQAESGCDLATYASSPCGPPPADAPEHFDVQTSFSQLDAATHGVIKGSLGSVPQVVITHGVPFPNSDTEKLFQAMQVNLASESSNTVHVTATRSDHGDILGEQPRVVTEAIRQVVGAAQGPNTQLAPCGQRFTKRGGACVSP